MRIVRGQVGDQAAPVTGVAVRMMRPTVSEYSGMKPGIHIVKSDEAWREIWERGTPKVPTGTDFQRTMIVGASGETKDLESIKVVKLVDAENTLHLFVKETRRGKNCLKAKDPLTLDFAVADRVDKPVMVHIDVADAPGCGEAPSAVVKCRVEGGGAMQAEVEATPGDLIECHADVALKGTFAIVERTWHLQDAPQGSAAKLNYDQSGAHTSFMTDMFGRYAVRYDVVDDAGRRTKADAVVTIPPPKTDNPFVQLAWSGFDASDDPATFPRTYLVAVRTSDASDCSTKAPEAGATRPAAWCDVKSQPTVRNMRLGTGGNIGEVPLFVHYQDDRFEGGPFLCVRTFFNGTKTAEVCDKSRRDAGAMWRPGVLDARTGTLMPIQDTLDAGAPKDAGSKAAKPAKPAPKK